MIQSYLAERLAEWLPDLKWTESFRPDDEGVGTVFYEGGQDPGRYDVPERRPRYQVYISSRDWDYAAYAAEVAFERLQAIKNERVEVEFLNNGDVAMTRVFYVQKIDVIGEPNDLGMADGVRDFSINLDASIIQLGEVFINGT